MLSLSSLGERKFKEAFNIKNDISSDSQPQTIHELAKLKAIENAGLQQIDFLKSYQNDLLFYKQNRKGNGAINAPKGMIEPAEWMAEWGYGIHGVREKFFHLSFRILRQIAQRTAPISTIQNVRCMQIRPFSETSYNDDDVGFRVKLKDKKGTPSKKDEKIMKEIEEFLLYSGYTNFEGADEREEGLSDVVELITREMMTIDQVAISLRRNKKNKILDYWILDAATIKRTMKDKGFQGDKSIAFVQEVNGRFVETFTKDDLIFYFMNRRTDIRQRGYGYSYIEMSLDMITAWLFAMAYNKEIFNSSSQPKGVISFEGEKIEQGDLEELQRQWISMFRGVKGMWRTPFLQHNAKWIPIAPPNRDMEFNEYTQTLASWICAIHGIDPAELGLRFNRTQATLYENRQNEITYSRDRGLKDILAFVQSILNKIIERVPEWDPYRMEFTGIEAKDQLAELNVDEKQTQVYMTINEKRKEKDLKPIDGGDIINNPNFLQAQQMKQMSEMQGGMSVGNEFGEEPEEDIEETPKEKEQPKEEFKFEKSKQDYIEILP